MAPKAKAAPKAETTSKAAKAVVPEKKRKASIVTTDAESDNEGSIDGLLDGVFSDSDEGSDDEADLDSDDVPSEGEDDEESRELAKLTLNNGTDGAEDEQSEEDENEDEDEDEDEEELEEDPDHDDDDDADKPNYRVTTDANGGVRYIYDEIDPVYDSDDSDKEESNTIGNIPLSFYDSYPHIGYDINGKKIMRPATGDALDALLESIELPEDWTNLTDPATGKPLKLNKEELELLKRVHKERQNDSEGAGDYDPYPDMVEYFSGVVETMPLSAAPEPKRRFVPSKHEAVRIAKMVRAIRLGHILPYKPRDESKEDEETQPHYDLWHDEVPVEAHIMHIPAPKLPPPGHRESYNCPPEYVPTKAERAAWEATDPEDREEAFLPAKYDSLRKVPGYGEFVKERFERCLDLYLAPRVRRNRLNIDPSSLLPKLPPAEELKPFPTVCQTVFRGHVGGVRAVAIDPTGNWLASGGDDGTVRLWELLTGRQVWSARLTGGKGHEDKYNDEPVRSIEWRPSKGAFVLAAAAGEDLYIIVPTVVVDPELEQASRAVVDAGFGYAAAKGKPPAKANDPATGGEAQKPPAKWSRPEDARLVRAGVLLQIRVRAPIESVSWHRRGEHFATVSPAGGRSAVAVHTLSRHLTQVPFRRMPNIPQAARFHPSQPLFFVATKQRIRVYDLQKMELVKTVLPGARQISSFDVHPTSGEHLIVGAYDRRLVWQDVEMASTGPYKTMRYHERAVRAVRFHRGGLPLFADTSDDGTLQIYFGRVYNDPLEYPTIVPLKKLERGAHKVVDAVGALDVTWHPKEAWCVSAGADGTCRLWM
ncbi:ribosome biogenesis protein ERB1 [Sporothrix brasiliensis 5110]|uniref:Ribosome biogenesis protein ERB1 n=1 Tax=Sporothrix brasiliensis 5110 TaxID=1398154 RepID=A0A0C2F7H4_9PEZI|nr:ribosome biogenesis protein ERB1 [Sporothrix brasiliensis 5110]KIH94929.1 ribosome biogenesis protein ERB1 [Sporothrix brasiliensis 5110]